MPPMTNTSKITPPSQRPHSAPYTGLGARSAKRFLAAQFSEAGLPTPDIDARALTLAATGLTHAALIAHGAKVLPDDIYTRIQDYARRRLSGEPVDHILGVRGFYGRDFKITKDVLSPRPDSEVLIDKALELLSTRPSATILDLGTGSGALIVTLLAECPKTGGVCVDISEAALGVAKNNAHKHAVENRLSAIQSDWFEHITGQYDLIISNPPYIDGAAMKTLSLEVAQFDPALALYGGEDGLAAYRIIAEQAAQYLKTGGHMVLEIGYDQGQSVPDLLANAGWTNILVHKDLAGHDRCITACL